MFFVRGNENKIKYGLRYSHYLIAFEFPWKLEVLYRRIRFDGFSFGFPLGFNFNFRLMSMSEYHEKYCPKIPECPLASKNHHEGLSFKNE
jgi:hypothetical protein